MDPRAAGGSFASRPRIVIMGRRVGGDPRRPWKAGLWLYTVGCVARGMETRKNGELAYKRGGAARLRCDVSRSSTASRGESGHAYPRSDARAPSTAGKSYAKKEHHLRIEED